VRQQLEATPPARRRSFGFLGQLAQSFAPELDRLKAAALGMALGALRDKLTEAVSPPLRENVTEMMDRVAVKLGGEPTPPGAMLGQEDSYEEGDGARMAQAGGFR
jgi:hypothetical protein